MTTKLIKTLEKLREEIPTLRAGKRTDPKFENWENKTIRTIKNIFGDDSIEYGQFSRVRYWYDYAGIQIEKMPRIEYEEKHFKNGLEKASLLLDDLIEEAKEKQENLQQPNSITFKEKKIFISHSSKDKEIGKEVINLLELMGVKPTQIIFTTADGYGIPLGSDWVEFLRKEVSGEGMVISLLSEEYFKSEVCMLEMGGTWVLSKFHIPILIPPMSFSRLNTVLKITQGLTVTDKLKWSTLKSQVESFFELDPIPGDVWEGKRDAILSRIVKLLSTE
ncbi:toll/interleukin-1 receptor domain-containing protein [Algoriphagus chordae]|uniref:TIR domain-containing protein n=1 Tax=Algoriphagus chordae TaxID=237019 RepID=A0A2W7R7E6_9BACT|nr:toll/interleukin-1 receptor domain-containing protein [Algoriphagus chordae]PZX50129.1 TIR domain-containing protein [Algoriphagus chordae]